MATIVQNSAFLFQLLNAPSLTQLLIKNETSGEIQIEAVGPGPMDRLLVVLGGGDTYDLLQYAVLDWWRTAPTLMNAVNQGWFSVPQEQVPPAAAPATPAVSCDGVRSIGFGPIVTLDFNPEDLPRKTLALTGDVQFITTNLSPGCALSLRITCDATLRTLTFPVGWSFLGAAAPASLAANKVGVLSLTSYGTTDAEIIATYGVDGATGTTGTVDYIVAAGVQVLFNLSATPAQPTAVLMAVNGQVQTYNTDFTVADAILTFLATDFAIQTGDNVTVSYQT